MWWQRGSVESLVRVLEHVNHSRATQNDVEKCDRMFNALNNAWNDFYQYRRLTGALVGREMQRRTDSVAFTQLLLQSLAAEERGHIIQSQQLEHLVNFAPKVMDHSTLRHHGYDPEDIGPDLREQAQRKHEELYAQYHRYKLGGHDSGLEEDLFEALTRLLYTVRSNIKHGEKTQRGPDRYKVQRDQQVCEATNPVLELILEMVLDHPSSRLAVYGTLSPGEPNNTVLGDLTGKWHTGRVQGVVDRSGYLPTFRWDVHGEEAQVKLFHSADLADRFPEIDRFEGNDYWRILVPVHLDDDSVVVANIYESVPD